MEKHFMIDIEATGIDPRKEDLLSVGILECVWDGEWWHPERSREWLCRTERQPESSFAKEHMAALYARCQVTAPWPEGELRKSILLFLRECGTTGAEDTYFMGWNASNFDLPFLVSKGALVPSSYEPGPDGKDRMVGDFHYRVYEIGGALSLAQNVIGSDDRNATTDLAEHDDAGPAFDVPPGSKAHDALYDCYRQLRILNGLISMARAHYRKPFPSEGVRK